MKRIIATSYRRWYGGIGEKRKYGGQGTVTQYLVGYEGTAPGHWRKIDGHGATPHERKRAAVASFRALTAAEEHLRDKWLADCDRGVT